MLGAVIPVQREGETAWLPVASVMGCSDSHKVAVSRLVLTQVKCRDLLPQPEKDLTFGISGVSLFLPLFTVLPVSVLLSKLQTSCVLWNFL